MKYETMINFLPQDGEAYLYPNLFTTHQGDTYFNILLKQILWKEEPIVIFGKKIMQPRLTAWYGEPGKAYSYSGITMQPSPWIPILLEIKARVEQVAGVVFNSALVNLYRHGQDSNGWHSDNEKELGTDPVIASVSFGATRVFQLKHRRNKELKCAVSLSHGSLLLMQGATQHHWLHCIPKTKKIIESRINITFRVIV